MGIKRFEEIEAWQDARIISKRVYALCRRDPFSKDWGLCDQIKRASGSVMHNIAEGFDSGTNPEFIRFLTSSQRSCSEVQSHLYLALDQAYISQDEFDQVYSGIEVVKKKIGGFIKYLSKTS